MKKQVIRLTESDLHKIIKESVNKILKETFISDKSASALEKAFTPILGKEILERGIEIVKGNVYPDKLYYEGHYTNRNTNLLADAIIKYPDGKLHTLMKK